MHGRDGALIDAEPTALILRAEGVRRLAPLGEHGFGHFEVDGFALHVDRDHVAVLDERERAAGRGFGRCFADDEPIVDEPRELAFRDRGDAVEQARAVEREDDGRRHRHAGSADDAQTA